MKICRICQQNDVTASFVSIFENNAHLPNILFNLFQLKIVDHAKQPALICRKCELSIDKAYQLKLQCMKSDTDFRQQTRDYEHFEWNDNLNALRRQIAGQSTNCSTQQPEVVNDHSTKTSNDKETNDEYEDTFQFLDAIGNAENESLFEKIASITADAGTTVISDDSIDSDDGSRNKYDEVLSILDNIELTPTQLENLTERINAILPPIFEPPLKPLKLRINLRKLKVKKKTKKSKKSPSARKEFSSLMKMRPRKNSIG